MIPIIYALRREANARFDAEGFPNGRPFLRRAAQDAHLLVTDAPQRLKDPHRVKNALKAAGLLAAEGDKLWHLDAPFSWYTKLAQMIPQVAQPMPSSDVLLPLFHLCRMLLHHPAPIDAQPLCMVRKTIKAMEAGEIAMLELAHSLPPQLAVLLREKKPLPSLAGGLIAMWLKEHPNEHI